MEPTTDPETVAHSESDRAIAVALNTADQGHDGYGCDDREGYAGIAQAHALVAIAYELRALRAALSVCLDGVADR